MWNVQFHLHMSNGIESQNGGLLYSHWYHDWTSSFILYYDWLVPLEEYLAWTVGCWRQIVLGRRDGAHSHYRRKPKIIIRNNLTYHDFTTVHVPVLCKVSIHGHKLYSGLVLREIDCCEMAWLCVVWRFRDMYHDATTHLTSEYKHMYHDGWNTVTWHLLHQGGVVNISIIDWGIIERLSAHAGAIPTNFQDGFQCLFLPHSLVYPLQISLHIYLQRMVDNHARRWDCTVMTFQWRWGAIMCQFSTYNYSRGTACSPLQPVPQPTVIHSTSDDNQKWFYIPEVSEWSKSSKSKTIFSVSASAAPENSRHVNPFKFTLFSPQDMTSLHK